MLKPSTPRHSVFFSWRFIIPYYRLMPLALFWLLCSDSAYAADDVPAIERAIHGFKDLITGPIAKSLAVIAIVFIGYFTLSGKMAYQKALFVCLGIGIIFGAADIAAALGAS